MTTPQFDAEPDLRSGGPSSEKPNSDWRTRRTHLAKRQPPEATLARDEVDWQRVAAYSRRLRLSVLLERDGDAVVRSEENVSEILGRSNAGTADHGGYESVLDHILTIFR